MNNEIAEAIIKWEHHDESHFFEEVAPEEIVDQSRWRTYYSQVHKDTRDETFWELSWGRGSTEQQDGGIEDIGFIQVEPKLVTITKYVPIKMSTVYMDGIK